MLKALGLDVVYVDENARYEPWIFEVLLHPRLVQEYARGGSFVAFERNNVSLTVPVTVYEMNIYLPNYGRPSILVYYDTDKWDELFGSRIPFILPLVTLVDFLKVRTRTSSYYTSYSELPDDLLSKPAKLAAYLVGIGELYNTSSEDMDYILTRRQLPLFGRLLLQYFPQLREAVTFLTDIAELIYELTGQVPQLGIIGYPRSASCQRWYHSNFGIVHESNSLLLSHKYSPNVQVAVVEKEGFDKIKLYMTIPGKSSSTTLVLEKPLTEVTIFKIPRLLAHAKKYV